MKKPIIYFGREYSFDKEITAFLKDWPAERGNPNLRRLELMALEPSNLFGKAPEDKALCPQMRDMFGKLYAENPDFVLAFMAMIRKANSNKTSDDFRVRRFLRTHPEAKAMQDGEIALAIEKETDHSIATHSVKKTRQIEGRQDAKRLAACIKLRKSPAKLNPKKGKRTPR